ncbi:MAG: alpha/beta hydrolase [Actinomycetia bacterium]|nr:alpha/beta hydrolase [Actinomycetes bacterium]MCP3912513.1 alpha/beta hydrolase [Actinomycetes bacterium]MCP4086680.1 alpha/beta hydrolase [Actinomycetes bacterium]
MHTELVTSADGTRVALHDLGGDGLPPVVFCHGNGMAGAMWQPVAQLLEGTIRPILVDFRGHGSSDNEVDIDVHWDRITEDLVAVTERVGELTEGRDLFGAGHSLGGAISLRVEALHPGTYAALTVFEPILFPPEGVPEMTSHPIATLARKRRMEFDSVDQIIERFGSRPPFDHCVPAALAAYAEAGTRSLPNGGVRLACEGELEARIFEAEHIDTWSRLGAVTCPVTVLAGTTVDNRPAELAEPVARALPNATFTLYESLTHMGPMEDPELFAQIIGAMVRSRQHR